MKKILALNLAAILLAVTVACSSSEFHVVLTMANTGFDYVLLVSGHPSEQPEANAAFASAGAVYDSFVGGMTTVDKVEVALTALAQQLQSIINSYHISDAKTLGLVELTIDEVNSLVKLLPLAQHAVLHKALKAPSAAQAKAVAPQFKTPAEYKAAFNLAAGAKVIK